MSEYAENFFERNDWPDAKELPLATKAAMGVFGLMVISAAADLTYNAMHFIALLPPPPHP